MENKKHVGSSSSFTNDLFGVKESSPSSASSGIFSSILQPPSRVGTKNCSSPELIGAVQKQLSGSQARNSEIHGDMIKNKEDKICIFSLQVLKYQNRIQTTRKMEGKMILVETIHKVPPEEIGGKGHFIISTLPLIPKACESIFIVSGIR
ncbi:unnamed protein product [Fraxinus pennsylvanica]|uniref:Uncharacterized protein n=1 Tax=Fraxinus pennsylvanica TaxID=56036 RepID=A0AAD1ZJB9_9LAMI|nr:unnamed protein product [Fraxinus pennsylvanica]